MKTKNDGSAQETFKERVEIIKSSTRATRWVLRGQHGAGQEGHLKDMKEVAKGVAEHRLPVLCTAKCN